ncbi:hypothetical protein KIPB_016826, partial [Kipferlia bialata]|eukprot:g16826.t1
MGQQQQQYGGYSQDRMSASASVSMPKKVEKKTPTYRDIDTSVLERMNSLSLSLSLSL